MTTYTSSQFEKAVQLIAQPPSGDSVQPNQDDKLIFYGLYKQATVGDNNTPKPGMMDFTGKYKWSAWDKQKGLSADEAKSKYVEHFLSILDKDGSEASQKLKAEVLAA